MEKTYLTKKGHEKFKQELEKLLNEEKVNNIIIKIELIIAN